MPETLIKEDLPCCSIFLSYIYTATVMKRHGKNGQYFK